MNAQDGTVYRPDRAMDVRDGNFYRRDGTVDALDRTIYQPHGKMEARHGKFYRRNGMLDGLDGRANGGNRRTYGKQGQGMILNDEDLLTVKKNLEKYRR
jgi:hypothetical protein